MKFNLTKGIVTLTSETPEEAVVLFTLATQTEKKVVEEKSRKRPVHTKQCDICGKGFKGLKGLGVHKRFIHGVKGDNAEANAEYYKKYKEAKTKEKTNHLETVNPNPERSFTGIWK